MVRHFKGRPGIAGRQRRNSRAAAYSMELPYRILKAGSLERKIQKCPTTQRTSARTFNDPPASRSQDSHSPHQQINTAGFRRARKTLEHLVVEATGRHGERNKPGTVWMSSDNVLNATN